MKKVGKGNIYQQQKEAERSAQVHKERLKNAKVEKNTSNEINVETLKAEGQKCSVCWKVSKNKCARPHCSLNINA